MLEPVRIANTCAFWGDRVDASAELLRHEPNIDFLTLDYLAEVSMSILAKLRQRDPSVGYAQDFVEVVRSLVPFWKDGRKFRVVTNAGGLNPLACAQACAAEMAKAGLTRMKIGVVSGDDVLDAIRSNPDEKTFAHLETGQSVRNRIDDVVTANAYLGADAIAQALRLGADVVITGRVADPSLTVAPCLAHFGWREDAFDRLAGATVAGHLIECGTQATGGVSTDWLDLQTNNIGYPIAEISDDGSCIISKPPGTSGAVNERIVKEQLLYELGDPANYLSPDVRVSFLTLKVDDLGADRVWVSRASGFSPPQTLKVSATMRAGFRASGMLTIIGRDAVAKARRAAAAIEARLKSANAMPQQFHVETLGSLDSLNGVLPTRDDLMETVLRITVADDRREIAERFSRELVPLVTAGPQGTTGYFDGRPAVREVYSYWPCLIDQSRVKPTVEIVMP
jgi:hypothetical protein